MIEAFGIVIITSIILWGFTMIMWSVIELFKE